MAGPEVKSIPNLTRVYKDTYANLPTSGVRTEDIGYATDRKVLYRWSGTAWEALTIYVGSGLAANIPVANTLPNGSIYFSTDTNILKEVITAAWAAISTPITSGSFTGDSTANRAIAHGLGRVPRYFRIKDSTYSRFDITDTLNGYITMLNSGAQTQRTVTNMDATNAYVGNAAEYQESANFNGWNYFWVAIG